MRVLLIATNRHNRLMSRMDARPVPIGLAYVAAYLDENKHQVETLDLMFAGEDYLEEVSEKTKSFAPDVVGISMRNLSNHSYLDPQWQLPITKEVGACSRELSNARIVCGGPAFSILPVECFEYVRPDFGIVGDAGEAFSELVDRLEIGEPSPNKLPGVVYSDNGLTISSNGRCSSTFDRPPNLERLDMQKYAHAGFGVGILTKLGGFYYPTQSQNIEESDTLWRIIRPIEEVVNEVIHMRSEYDLKKVFFIDNCFNAPLQHAKDLCRSLIDAHVSLRWNTCLGPFGCDTELIDLMKTSGCGLVLMTSAGGDAHDGNNLEKNNEELLETCRMCEDRGLKYSISQRFGGPGETRGSVEEKLQFLKQLDPALVNLRIGLSLMPGTPEAKLALDEGLISSESDLIEPTFYISPNLRDWLPDKLVREAGQHPRWNVF